MISALNLENFRLFESLSLSFDSRSVIFSGANGQGKTSILEAIFYLSNLRSFRTARIREMRRLGSSFFRISGVVSREKWRSNLEIEQENTLPKKLKIDGVPVTRASDFSGSFRTIAFLPDDIGIVSGTSRVRRRFLNMFISMLDKEYFIALQQYCAALKNRNILLRIPSSDPEILKSYHPVLAQNGFFIQKKREAYLKLLTDSMKGILTEIRPEFKNFSILKRSPHDPDSPSDYRKRLDDRIAYDRESAFTTTGPHLDQFDFIASGRNLRIYGSTGQKRIIAFALKMAEFDIACTREESRKNTVVLVDDATHDLDYRTRNAFFERIQTAGQLFFTFTDLEDKPLFHQSKIIALAGGKAS